MMLLKKSEAYAIEKKIKAIFINSFWSNDYHWFGTKIWYVTLNLFVMITNLIALAFT